MSEVSFTPSQRLAALEAENASLREHVDACRALETSMRQWNAKLKAQLAVAEEALRTTNQTNASLLAQLTWLRSATRAP